MNTLYYLDNLGFSHPLQDKIGLTIFYILLLTILRLLIGGLIDKRIKDVKKHYYWARTATYGTSLLGLILIISVWLKSMSSFATYLGLVTAGLALALRDIIANFAGWIFIILRQPFRMGDRIQIGNFKGDIIDINILQFSILEIGNWVDADQSTGRIIDIPNGMVLTQPIANYTKGFEYIWDEIPVLITFESNWKKAKELLNTIALEKAEKLSQDAENQIRAAAQKYMIFYKHLTPTVYTDVKDSCVRLTIRYLAKTRNRRIMVQTIWEAILEAFAKEPDIDLAYTTRRIFDNTKEGKKTFPPHEVGQG